METIYSFSFHKEVSRELHPVLPPRRGRGIQDKERIQFVCCIYSRDHVDNERAANRLCCSRVSMNCLGKAVYMSYIIPGTKPAQVQYTILKAVSAAGTEPLDPF